MLIVALPQPQKTALELASGLDRQHHISQADLPSRTGKLHPTPRPAQGAQKTQSGQGLDNLGQVSGRDTEFGGKISNPPRGALRL